MKLYTLPELPYGFGSLEPYIDALTMEIHHDRHHAAYIENLNNALNKHPDLFATPLPDLLADLSSVPEDIRTAVRNNGGGTLNHTEFWKWMTPRGGGAPKGKSGKHLMDQWKSFAAFQEEFNTAAKTRFGSGWAWLCINAAGNLQITSTANQDSPLSEGLQPILGLDVWEHAYYLKYMNKRPDYINAWWHVVNWEYVEELYEKGK